MNALREPVDLAENGMHLDETQNMDLYETQNIMDLDETPSFSASHPVPDMSRSSLGSTGSRDGACAEETEEDECILPKSAQSSKKISFPADSILNAVIQEGDIIELLRILRHQRAEIDLNQKNHVGLTALHHAVLTNNLDSVKLLINYGANVRVQDLYGFSPLHTAAALGFLQMTSLLILFGADVFSKTKQSEYPIDLAKDVAVIRVLCQEMCLQVHTETFLKSFLRVKAVQVVHCLYAFLVYLWRTLMFTVDAMKHKYSHYRRLQEHDAKANGGGIAQSSIEQNSNDTQVPGDTVPEHIEDIEVKKTR